MISVTRVFVVLGLLRAIISFGADYSQKADEYLKQELKSERFMGSVLVARSNQIVFIKPTFRRSWGVVFDFAGGLIKNGTG